MKKISLAVWVIVSLAACSKSDTSTPRQLIQGDWTGASLLKTGYIDGVAIDIKDTVGDGLIRSLNLTFYTDADDKNSIKGIVDPVNVAIAGVYALDLTKNPHILDAKLYIIDPRVNSTPGAIVDLSGNVAISQDSLVVSRGVKEAVEFGNKTSDSTVTVMAFARAK